jgi:tRNA dimethylallyltransferase
MSFSEHPLENILALVGPTASGKSSLSVELANRAHLKGHTIELISMDSALVYRGMSIGTAKPSALEQTQVQHHGIDIRDPWQSYSAAQFAKDVVIWVKEIQERGHYPVIVGGTMLYWRALMQGLTDLPSSTPEVREEIALEARQVGWDVMYQQLQNIDPETAARLPPGDTQRISRALEVHAMTGQTMSSFLKKDPYSTSRDDAAFQHRLISLEPATRSWLHQRIEERFYTMLKKGFLAEVEHLLKQDNIHESLPSMRAVGYRQAISYLAGDITEDEFIQAGLAASRQLGKRQLTWLRAMPSRQIVDPSNPQSVQQAIDLCLQHIEARSK